jgi:tetratricopeptide (TPR) repeat protein
VIARRRLVLFGPALLAAGCASAPQSTALRAQRPAGLPLRHELEATPFFAQTAYQCGPAALATVLAAAGRPVAPELLTEQVFLPARSGTLQVEMLAGARRNGALAFRTPGRIDALLAETTAGTPVVVLLNLGLSLAPRWHYAVLVGHDLERDELVLRSGTTRRQPIQLTPFEQTWTRAGHWAFVALPPGRLPASAGEEEVAQATVAFERIAAPADAVRAYEAAAAHWPHNLTLAMGLGNTRHVAGDAAGAAQAFALAAERHDSAAAWNNLARVRWQLGERDAARSAAQRALQRAREAEPRWLDAATATLQAVN